MCTLFHFILLSSLSSSYSDLNGWTTSHNLDKWYSPWEVCLLNHSITSKYPWNVKKHRDECCKMHNLPRVLFGECKIGGTRFGNTCSLNFTSKPELLFSYSREYDDPSKSYLAHFWTKLMKSTERIDCLLCIGDSQMMGIISAMNCELQRFNLARPKIDMSKFPPRFHHFFDPNETIHHFNNLIANSNCSEIFILINFGTHYNTKEQYKTNIEVALPYLNKIGAKNNVTVAWMETLPQHFNTSNGYFAGKSSQVSRCVPISNSSKEADWRNYLFHKTKEEKKLNNIHVIKTRDIFEPLHNLHGFFDNDCTHYCWSPMLYLPLFHQMDIIYERKSSFREKMQITRVT